jgi:hypothetical protein
MLTFLQIRRRGGRLGGSLRHSVLNQPAQWVVGADEAGRSRLEMGRFVITLTPRLLRLFDATHVYCDGSEVWLPLVARLRLRNAVRLLLIDYAAAHAPEIPDSERRLMEQRKSATHEHAA